MVFIVSAPSGSGKSTIVSGLLETVPGLRFSISYTTRNPRGVERHGESYYFTNRASFEQMALKGEFLEHAQVFSNFYGTHQSELEFARAERKDLVLDIDVQGAAQLKRKIAGAVSIFILAPSRDVLERRLRSRSEDSEEVIQRRLNGAAAEIRNYRLYDYVLINRDVESSVAALAGIVTAERMRRERMEDQIRPILETFKSSEVL